MNLAAIALSLGGQKVNADKTAFFTTRGAVSNERIQRLVDGKSPGRHRIRHGMRHQRQPDDVAHAGMRIACRLPSTSRETSTANTSPMVAHITTCVPSENSRNS